MHHVTSSMKMPVRDTETRDIHEVHGGCCSQIQPRPLLDRGHPHGTGVHGCTGRQNWLCRCGARSVPEWENRVFCRFSLILTDAGGQWTGSTHTTRAIARRGASPSHHILVRTFECFSRFGSVNLLQIHRPYYLCFGLNYVNVYIF